MMIWYIDIMYKINNEAIFLYIEHLGLFRLSIGVSMWYFLQLTFFNLRNYYLIMQEGSLYL